MEHSCFQLTILEVVSFVCEQILLEQATDPDVCALGNLLHLES